MKTKGKRNANVAFMEDHDDEYDGELLIISTACSGDSIMGMFGHMS